MGRAINWELNNFILPILWYFEDIVSGVEVFYHPIMTTGHSARCLIKNLTVELIRKMFSKAFVKF